MFLHGPQNSAVTIQGIQAFLNTAASFDTSRVHVPCTGMQRGNEGVNVPALEQDAVLLISPAWYFIGLSCCPSAPIAMQGNVADLMVGPS